MSCTKTTNNKIFLQELLDCALQSYFDHRWDDTFDGATAESGHYQVKVNDSIGGIIEINIKGLVKEKELEKYYRGK